MFNLYQILTGAQGGQALDNLAERFGLSREQADSAVQALMPALSTAFMTKAMHPGGAQSIASAMTDDQHKQAYADPDAAATPETQCKGADVASSIFGNDAMVQSVTEQASRYTGIPEDTLRQMLPMVISIVVGGVATAMHNQGMGGWLSQIANSGMGNIFGQTGATAAAGGAPGMLGSILGGLFGGQQASGGPTAGPAGWPGGLPPAVQAGMEAFGKMFQPGVQGQPGQMGNLGDEISSILSGRRS